LDEKLAVPLVGPLGCGSMPAAGRALSRVGTLSGMAILAAVSVSAPTLADRLELSLCAKDAEANEATPIKADAARTPSFIQNSLGL
jgi:hypothetical protein